MTRCASLVIEDRLNVAYVVTRGDDLGGAQMHVRDLAAAMREQGHKATIICGPRGIFTDDLAVVAMNVVHAGQALVWHCLLAEQSRRVGSWPVKASVAAGFAGCSLDQPQPPGTLASKRECRRRELT